MAIEVYLEKALGNFKLDVEFSAGDDIVGLLGASGCGKSMTLKCIAGLEQPDKGYIVVNGRVLYDSSKGISLSPQERKAGYLFQNGALFPQMTVEQNVWAGCCAIKDKKERRDKTQDLLRRFHIADLAKHYPRHLSGGQIQRTALARILASEPDLLMLDEPFSALDQYQGWLLEQELLDTVAGFKGNVILVSHDKGEIYRLSSKACVIHEGKSEPLRNTKDLFFSPQTLAEARLSGMKNFSTLAWSSSGEAKLQGWEINLKKSDLPKNRDVQMVGIPSSALCIAEEKKPGAMRCIVEKKIEEQLFLSLVLQSTLPKKQRIFIDLPIEKSAHSPKIGEEVWIEVNPKNILYLKS